MAKKAAKKKAAKKPKPRQQQLGGMDHLPKIQALHNVCETLAEVREEKNDLVTKEKELTAKALELMQRNNRTTYQAHGVELARIPGADKLRVRLAEGEAETSPEEAGDGADESGEE
jgi:hypothetical protein